MEKRNGELILIAKRFLVGPLVHTLFPLYNSEPDGFIGSDSIILSFARARAVLGHRSGTPWINTSFGVQTFSGKGMLENEGSNSKVNPRLQCPMTRPKKIRL